MDKLWKIGRIEYYYEKIKIYYEKRKNVATFFNLDGIGRPDTKRVKRKKQIRDYFIQIFGEVNHSHFIK